MSLVLLRLYCKSFNVLFPGRTPRHSFQNSPAKLRVIFELTKFFEKNFSFAPNFPFRLVVFTFSSGGRAAALPRSLAESGCKIRDFIFFHQMFLKEFLPYGALTSLKEMLKNLCQNALHKRKKFAPQPNFLLSCRYSSPEWLLSALTGGVRHLPRRKVSPLLFFFSQARVFCSRITRISRIEPMSGSSARENFWNLREFFARGLRRFHRLGRQAATGCGKFYISCRRFVARGGRGFHRLISAGIFVKCAGVRRLLCNFAGMGWKDASRKRER